MIKITVVFLLIAVLALAYARNTDVLFNKYGLNLKHGKVDKRVDLNGFGSQCTILECAKTGKECSQSDLGHTILQTDCLSSNDYCNHTSVDSKTSNYFRGVCLTLPGLGQFCNTSVSLLRCQSELMCDSTTNKCIEYEADIDDILPGHPCNSNRNCTHTTSTGTEHSCSGSTCAFTPNGQSCNTRTSPDEDQEECNDLTSACLYNNGTYVCTLLAAAGQSCNQNFSANAGVYCQKDLSCVPNAVDTTFGICKELFSQKENQPCNDISDCAKGYCTSVPRDSKYLYGVCQNFKKTSTLGKDCAADSDCTTENNEECVCDSDGQSKCVNYYINRDQNDNIEKYQDCHFNALSECATSSNKASQNNYDDCVQNKCKDFYCKIYKAQKNNGYAQDCTYANLCGAASSLVVSLPLLLAAAIVMLIQ